MDLRNIQKSIKYECNQGEGCDKKDKTLKF